MAIGAGCFGSIFRGSGNQKIQCGRLVKWNFTMMMVRSLLLLPLFTWFNFYKTTTLKLLHLMSGWLPIGCSDSWENKIRIRLFAIHFILFSASCGLAGRGRNIRRKSSQKGGGNYSRKNRYSSSWCVDWILWAGCELTGYDDRTRFESSEWMRGWRIASLKLELERVLNVTNSRQSSGQRWWFVRTGRKRLLRGELNWKGDLFNSLIFYLFVEGGAGWRAFPTVIILKIGTFSVKIFIDWWNPQMEDH